MGHRHRQINRQIAECDVGPKPDVSKISDRRDCVKNAWKNSVKFGSNYYEKVSDGFE